jgi:hypothetical protein
MIVAEQDHWLVRVVATDQHANAVFLWQVGNVGNGHYAIPRLRDDLPLGWQLGSDRLAVHVQDLRRLPISTAH